MATMESDETLVTKMLQMTTAMIVVVVVLLLLRDVVIRSWERKRPSQWWNPKWHMQLGRWKTTVLSAGHKT
jgi:hypothetical protein